MKTFCTYFDSRYLTRGLALWESLTEHVRDFELYVLCLDDDSRDALERLALRGIRTITLRELETSDPEVAAVKPTRELVEYYFTITPALPLHILRQRPDLGFITYLDADLFFFGDVQPLFDELGDASVGIIAHRFPQSMQHLARYGTFNVGCLIFRNDDAGRTVLEWWRERCIEWCFDRLEGDRFADQKYLDSWPSRFRGVVVLQHRGANVAPWNIGGSTVSEGDGRLLIDAQPLLFYHFHRLREWLPSLWQLSLLSYRAQPTRLLVDGVYRPYIARLERWRERLAAAGFRTRGGTARAVARLRLAQVIRAPWYLLRRELIVTRAAERAAPPVA